MHEFQGALLVMSLSSNRSEVLRLVIAFCASAIVSQAAAVTAPYQDNFDSYANGTQPANFVTAFVPGPPPQPIGYWQVNNPKGRGAYAGILSGYQSDNSAAISVTNVDNVGFILSTTFTVRSRYIGSAASIELVGLGALSNGPDFSTSGYQLFYDTHDGHLGYEGTLSITAGGPNHGHYIAFSWVSMPFTDGTTYIMTLQGIYSINGLTLIGTLSNGRKILTVSGTDNFPQHGTYFGYYEHVDGDYNHHSSETVDFDNFAITLPGFATHH